uniref:Ig-like domain-containing protein n=1 Tax=Myotis lucifugus TaxID=59463 RepID=G1Q111_MYOLU
LSYQETILNKEISLIADAVVSVSYVTGVVGQSVTLPCIFSTAHEISPMCWGRRACPSFSCSNELIMTDGYHVTFEKDKRYRMNGIISRGNLSLTIQNAALSDTGTYCCRIEFKGWFNGYKKNIFLEIKPGPRVKTPPKVTSVPTPSKVFTSAPTTPAPTLNHKTGGFLAAPEPTRVPRSPGVSNSATAPVRLQNIPKTTSSSPLQTTETPPITPQEASTTTSALNSSCPTERRKKGSIFTGSMTEFLRITPYRTDGNSTVTQPSDSGWQYNETSMLFEHTSLKQNKQRNTSKLYIGLSSAAMILLTILAAILTKKLCSFCFLKILACKKKILACKEKRQFKFSTINKHEIVCTPGLIVRRSYLKFYREECNPKLLKEAGYLGLVERKGLFFCQYFMAFQCVCDVG